MAELSALQDLLHPLFQRVPLRRLWQRCCICVSPKNSHREVLPSSGAAEGGSLRRLLPSLHSFRVASRRDPGSRYTRHHTRKLPQLPLPEVALRDPRGLAILRGRNDRLDIKPDRPRGGRLQQ